ncbi:MAG: hypothetical protein GQ574_11895 [Crocinitomix sp.]|nr:hypothetical protein [Crocinitomix sp.]
MKKTISNFKGNGGQIEAGDFLVSFDKNSLEENTEVKAFKGKKNVDLVNKELLNEGVISGAITGKGTSYDIQLNNKKLLKPAVITLKYNKKEHGDLNAFYNLRLAQEHDGQVYLLPTFFDDKKQIIYAETNQFSTLVATSFYMMAGIAIPILLSIAQAVKRSTTDVNFLKPESIDDTGFSIDKEKMELNIKGKTLKGKVASWPARPPRRPDEWIKKDTLEGHCTDWAFLFGSLLIKRGYKVRLVTGRFAAWAHDKSSMDDHIWVEVVIDGKVYLVDTLTPGKRIKLIPRDKAYELFEVNIIDEVLWKEKVGDKYHSYPVRKNFNRDWWQKYSSEKIDFETSSNDMYDFMDKADANYEKYKDIIKIEYTNYSKLLNNGGSGIEWMAQCDREEKHLELRELQISWAYNFLSDLKYAFDDNDISWLGVTRYKKKNIYSLIEKIKIKRRKKAQETAPEDFVNKFEHALNFWEELYFENLD